MLIIGSLLMFYNIAAKMSDMYITYLALSVGLSEGNPIINFFEINNWFWLELVSIIILTTTGIYIYIKKFDFYFKLYCYCLIFVNVILTIVVFFNLSLITARFY